MGYKELLAKLSERLSNLSILVNKQHIFLKDFDVRFKKIEFVLFGSKYALMVIVFMFSALFYYYNQANELKLQIVESSLHEEIVANRLFLEDSLVNFLK